MFVGDTPVGHLLENLMLEQCSCMHVLAYVQLSRIEKVSALSYIPWVLALLALVNHSIAGLGYIMTLGAWSLLQQHWLVVEFPVSAIFS